MLGLIDNLARRLVRRGFRRGLIEGNPIWLVVGAAALLARLLTRPEPDKLVRERIRLGETITVTHGPAPVRDKKRGRRRAHRSPYQQA